MSSWTAASSDCSRPVNNYVHVKTADLYRPNARLTPERQGYQVLTPFGKLGYSQFLRPQGWSPDGALLFEYRGAPGTSLDIAVLPADGDGAWEPLLDMEADEQAPAISPDGQWIAYTSTRTGEQEIYVQRFPELGGEQLVSRGGGRYPVWSQDGRELLYRRFPNGLMAMSVEPGPNLQAGIAETLFDPAAYLGSPFVRHWDASPDGRRLLMIRQTGRDDQRRRVRDRPDPELVRGTQATRPDKLMPLQPGTTLGPYSVTAKIGEGGMGEVYKARDTRLDRTVAIKVMPAHVASDPDLKQRFEREAKTISSLNHPHICTLYDIGSQDGIDFLVMEYLEGDTLAQRLEKGALPLDQALTVAIEVADALDKAHRQGITHRDLKPGNIMLTKAGAISRVVWRVREMSPSRSPSHAPRAVGG